MLFGDDEIWSAQSENLKDWEPSTRTILAPRPGYFDEGYVEVGPPPIETEAGWLVVYHGVQKREDLPGDPRVYRLGVALLDRDDPTRLLARSEQAVLEPLEAYETAGQIDAGYIDMLIRRHGRDFRRFRRYPPTGSAEGWRPEGFPLAVFCCGAVERQGVVSVYYGAMDTSICLAEGTVDGLLQGLRRVDG